MRVKDEQLWTQQLAELDTDDQTRLFRDFLVEWADQIDRFLGGSWGASGPHVIASKAFDVTEQTLGFVSVEWLSQMMLLLVQHWVYGDELWESLSVWEQRLVEQAAVLKLAELQDQAGEAAETMADLEKFFGNRDVTSNTP